MNYSAEICAVLLNDDDQCMLVDAVEDHVGLTAKTCEALLARLCADGTLKRERDYISIANEGRARVLASEARLNNKASLQRGPSARGVPPIPPVKRRRAPITVPVPELLKLDEGIPVPPKFGYRVLRPIPWPFAKMKVGVSFAVPVPEGMEAKDVAEALRKDVATYQRRTDPKFRTAIRIEEGEKTVRLWRVDDEEPKTKTPKSDPLSNNVPVNAPKRRGRPPTKGIK